MKISSSQSFLHPVFRPNSNDFNDSCNFTLEVGVDLNKSMPTQVSLLYKIRLDIKSIRERLASKEASLYLDIRCSDTIFQQTILLEIEESEDSISGVVALPDSRIRGAVSVVAVVAASKTINNYSPSEVHAEYSGGVFVITCGFPLAVSTTWKIPIDFDSTAIASLLRVQLSPNLPKNSYQIRAEDEQLTILVGTQMHLFYSQTRDSMVNSPYLFLSLYKDCIVGALEKLGSNPDISYMWAISLKDKLEELEVSIGEDTPFSDLNEIALQLLSSYGIDKLVEIQND